MKVLRFISVVVLLLCVAPMYAQSTKQQKLEEERQRLRQEIEQMRRLREENKVKELSVLDEVESISAQISTRQNLIKITNQQTNLLTREINSNLNKIDTYRNELKVLKEDYANMVKKSYKSKSHQSRIMFLLSSSNFTQAYKRLQYMKQYNEHRKEQADRIEKNTMELQQLNRNLSKQKEDKETLISENREAQEKLKEEKKEQQVLMASIKKKQGVYTKQIKKKQERASAIDKQIEKLIREAIARANKKAGSKVANKGTATTFAMTAEAKVLADNFTSNKGKLPWPVGTGRLTKKYGRQPHPTLPNIQINSNGVEIETRSGERVRSIFDGEVIAVRQIKRAGLLVQIRHGNYISAYYNLQNISVKEGQKVSTKQAIGEVRTNPKTGRAVMKLLIYQNTKKLNPQNWVYRM